MKKKEAPSKKYFYDEIQDQIIVNFVLSDLAKRQEERKKFELIWELNMNFYFGNQYCYISNNSEISDIEKKYYWENREVYNHIAPIIEARLSKLGKINPSFSVKSNSHTQNRLTSSLENIILQSAISNNDFKELICSATYWSEITGTSFYKVSWENDLGDNIGEKDGQIIKSGDVKISVCSPFEIYPDSSGYENLDDCESIIEVRSLPVKFINEKYNKSFTGTDIDLFELGSNAFLSGMSGRSNITKVVHSKKHDQALLIERYEKPTQKNPNGKLTIVCEDTLIYDGDLPYLIGNKNVRGFPFVRQVSTKQIGCFWGASVIERCIPIQRSYNAIKNKKHEFIERLAGGVLSVEDGSVDIDNLESEGLAPGKILIYRNGSTPPKFLDVNEIPKDLEDEEEKLMQELSRVSSVSEVMSSSTIPNNITSGSALSLLINQDNSRLSLTAENIRNSITKVAKMILRLYKQFAEIPRLCMIPDEKGVEEPYYWCKNNLTFDEVCLDVSNELDENSTANLQTVISLFEKGFFNEEDGTISKPNKKKLLSMLGVKNFDFESEIDKLNKLNANVENQNILKIGEPNLIDDHKIHLSEHTKFLLSKIKTLTDEEKEKLTAHIISHKNILKEEK